MQGRARDDGHGLAAVAPEGQGQGQQEPREGEDVFFTLEEVKAHVGLTTNVSTETDATFRSKVKRWAAETAARPTGSAGATVSLEMQRRAGA